MDTIRAEEISQIISKQIKDYEKVGHQRDRDGPVRR